MTKEQLEKLLNTACEIITDMEEFYFSWHPRDSEMAARIDALFEAMYSDTLDADMEAQDHNTFGENKI